MVIKPYLKPWNGKMTDRERFNKQMHFQSFDRSFNMEFGFWEENFKEWPLFADNNIKSNKEANIFFSFDRYEEYVGEVWMNPVYKQEVVEETPTTKIMINVDGLYAEIPKDGHDTVPHFVKSSIVTPDDWKRCKEERFRADDPARIVDVEAIRKVHPKERKYPLGVYCGSMIGSIRNMLTFEGLAYACYDYPDMVEDMVETLCVLVENFLDQVLPHIDFDYATGWEDICFKNGPIVTVDFFKNVVMPRYKRISKKLHKAGIDVWYTDCDGDVRPLLPYFLEGGINCMFPHEVNSSGHPGELLKQYEGELRIIGGVDKTELVKGPEAIKNYLEALVPLVEKGGYIPMCDHFCPPNVKPEDYLYYLELKEKLFGM